MTDFSTPLFLASELLTSSSGPYKLLAPVMASEIRSEKSTWVRTDEEIDALRAIVEGTAEQTGDKFFQALVQHMARAMDASHAFIAEFSDVKTRVRTLAYWADGQIAPNIEFDLAGTPCEEVVGGTLCHHPVDVQEKCQTV